jgi:hypothetical protein
MAAVFALDHLLGGVDIGVGRSVRVMSASSRSSTLRWFARGLDDEGGVGVAGVGVPLAAQGCMRSSRPPSPPPSMPLNNRCSSRCGSSLSSQEVIQAHAHHQANRHMPAFGAGLSSNCRPLGKV